MSEQTNHTEASSFTPETVNLSGVRAAIDRFNPMVAFANGQIKLPSFKRGPVTVDKAFDREAQELTARPKELEREMRTRFSPESYLPELFGKTAGSAMTFSDIEPIASGRRLAFKVSVFCEVKKVQQTAILVQKDLRNEKRFAEYLKLVGLNNYGIVCGPENTDTPLGAIEAIPGKSFGHLEAGSLEGFSEAVAFELGTNFYAAYLLGKQDRARSNYFFSATPSELGQVVTAIDHEDLFQLDPGVYRKTAQNEEIDMLRDLPLYEIDRTLVLRRFEQGVQQQRQISLDRQGEIKAIIADAAPSFVTEFERRIEENPLDVLDKIYAFRARMERNIFARMKRKLLGRW